MSYQPVISDAKGNRRFACSAVGLVAIIINEEEQFLLLSSPVKRGRNDSWESVSGALEAGETILEGVLRETREEIGSEVKTRPLGTVHAQTIHYDEKIRYMISICYLMAYEGGQIQPGDDVLGSQYKWWSFKELEDRNIKILVPSKGIWVFKRAVELYRLWKCHDLDLQQLGLDPVD